MSEHDSLSYDLDVCECGHIRDEHEPGGPCQAECDGEPCGCIHFDKAA